MGTSESTQDLTALAIVGVSGRFPGARNVKQFWNNLRAGIESITHFSPEQARSFGIDSSRFDDPRFVPAAGILEESDQFDASFFGMSPREASITDPQHRLFLECSWEALEDAGYDPRRCDESIGVFGGTGTSSYLLSNVSCHPNILSSANGLDVELGNRSDYLPLRVSYNLGLRGPSVAVQTACSTSLVAVHLACESLLNGQCDMALAGGVTVTVPESLGYLHFDGGVWSSDGHCRAFDARADGTAFGSGVGIVVLKRLQDAVEDGDFIYALIRGSAVNNDGAAKVGFTAPGIDGQAAVISEAMAIAGLAANQVSYVETHGTGTALGDPIEVAALTQAFRATTERCGYCAIGSVKTSVGHLVAAAGIASLIKTVLALKNEEIPASLHYECPNPEIDFARTPFFVNSELRPWKRRDEPRRASVSSFGMGGTNAHVVLEEAPLRKGSAAARPCQLLLLSARTQAALEAMTEDMRAILEASPDLDPADVAYTSQVGRATFSHRRVVVYEQTVELARALDELPGARVVSAVHDGVSRRSSFMFSGQGSQYVNMARELHELESTFRSEVDHCARALEEETGCSLLKVLFPEKGDEAKASQQLTETRFAQPALFTIEYALARLLMSWGIEPDAMIGHSIGEYTAACIAGVFTRDDCLKLVAARGRMMQELPRGKMAAVQLPESEVAPLLSPEVSLAAVNAPSLCVVAGETDQIESLLNRLVGDKIQCRVLHTSHAFHSAMMDPMLSRFEDAVRRLSLKPPQIPFLSNVTGRWITDQEATDPRYWSRHVRSTVRFADGLRQLLKDGRRSLVEVGPGNVLATLARQNQVQQVGTSVVNLVRRPDADLSDARVLLTSVGRLWQAGVSVDWEALHAGEHRLRVPLPTYPFERKRHWLQSKGIRPDYSVAASDEKNPNLDEWFYEPVWTQAGLHSQPSTQASQDPHEWLVFADDSGWGDQLVRRMESAGHNVVVVKAGRTFKSDGPRAFNVNPKKRQDYSSLIGELASRGRLPSRIVHTWSVTAREDSATNAVAFQDVQDLAFYSMLFLAQSLRENGNTGNLQIDVISTGLQKVTGDEPLSPAKATLLGPCKVIPQEVPGIRCRSIDIPFRNRFGTLEEMLLGELIETRNAPEPVVAYRGARRWTQSFRRLPSASGAPTRSLCRRGAYLITGGLGQVGFLLAEHLAKMVRADLVLTGRSFLPPAEDRDRWLQSHDATDATSDRIRRIRRLEDQGSQVLYKQMDIAELQHCESVVQESEARFGCLNGVIHAAADSAVFFTRVEDLNRENCEANLAPKIRGVQNLDVALAGRQLDFVLLTSSLSSVLGGIGYAAYAAGNAYMDAFCQMRHGQTSVPWISVNWESWHSEEGQKGGAKSGASLNRYGLTSSEGVRTFAHVLSGFTVPQVVVSTGTLESRLNRWIRFTDLDNAPGVGPTTSDVEAHSDESASTTNYVAPRGNTERVLVEIWRQLLGVKQICVRQDFFDLGGHSLLAVSLFDQIEKSLGTRLPLASLLDHPTIEGLASLLEASETETSSVVPSRWSSLVPINAHGSRPPFFLVHGAGGNILLYRDLARHLGQDQTLYGLQAQGLDGDSPPLETVEEMASHYLEEIGTVQSEGPYFLGGYCMGGTVALQMSQELRARGEEVALLALFDTQAHWQRVGVHSLAYQLLQRVAFHVGNLVTAGPGGKGSFLSGATEIAKRRLRRFVASTAQALGVRRAEHIVLVGRINDAAAIRYSPRPYDGRVTCFLSKRSFTGHTDPRLGWADIALGGVDVQEVDVYPGGMLIEPFVERLAIQLAGCLERASAERKVEIA